MDVLVTGGSGFIGGNLTKKLINYNHNVRCLVRNTSNTQRLDKLNTTKIYGDLNDYDSLLTATEGIECVFHCAALVSDWAPPQEFLEVNVYGTQNLLKACVENKVSKFIHISTTDAVWNFEEHININELHPYPPSFKHPYCDTKARAERIVSEYYHKNKIDTVIIRPCLVWGPGDNVVLPKLVELAVKNQLFIIGNGNNIISMSYIDNLINAIILASLKRIAIGSIYFINDGIDIKFYDFLSVLMQTLNIDWRPIKIPYNLAYLIAYLTEKYNNITHKSNSPLITRYAVAAMGRNLQYDTKKAITELDYNPDIKVDAGMKRLKQWVDSIGGIEKLINNK